MTAAPIRKDHDRIRRLDRLLVLWPAADHSDSKAERGIGQGFGKDLQTGIMLVRAETMTRLPRDHQDVLRDLGLLGIGGRRRTTQPRQQRYGQRYGDAQSIRSPRRKGRSWRESTKTWMWHEGHR